MSGLVVVADGVLVGSPVPDARVQGWMGVVPDARDLYVRYDLSGVSQRSGSATGRALATVTSLTLGVGPDQLARTQTFTGSKFLALACLERGAARPPSRAGRSSAAAGRWTSPLMPPRTP